MSWPKHLTVDKNIVLLLSASTYENFPRALRELVSNAYDADATSVSIDISPKKKTVTVQDNGRGMTSDEFDFFLRIAGQERSQTRTTESGRTRVGQFGIGFLAMFPFCKTVEIKSTVAGSVNVFVARIPAAQFCRSTESQDVTEALVRGEEFQDRSHRSKHYTRITLIDTTTLLDRYLKQQQDKKKYKNSIRSMPALQRLRWELQDILPLPYPDDSVIAQFIDPSPIDFSVSLNGTELVANDYVEEVLANSDEYDQVGKIRFRWAIGTPWHIVKPDEARGLRVRLHRVGVGARQYFDLGVAGRTFSRLNWLTGEVNILAGLDESIAVDRDGFTQSQDYEDFREFFRSKLRELAFYVEDIDEAKRKISAQLTQSPRAAVAPTEDVVAQQVKRLEKRGFEVKRNDRKSPGKSAVTIDTEHRIVTINTAATKEVEVVPVANRRWHIKYDTWEASKQSDYAYRLSGRNTIILNQDYPLFKGAHKDVFRKLQIIIAHAQQNSNTKKQFLDALQDALLQQFERR